MAVQFILGRSGTGKTTCCVSGIIEALLEQSEQQLIFLVPEQATYQAERAILSDKRIAGYNRLNVLSFDRLQFLLLGKNTARPALSRIGQQMIIHRIMRDNVDKLQAFGRSANWPGLSRQMARTITELHQYAKMPADIDQLLAELRKDPQNNLAALKFSDIRIVLEQYLNFIEEKFIDPDVQLTQACRAVSLANFARGAKLWVDGFASFTAGELAVLTELLRVVEDAQIALCLDPSFKIQNSELRIENLGADLFGTTQQTYTVLIELIKKHKLQLAEPVILNKGVRFTRSRTLAHVEQNIFADVHTYRSRSQPAKIKAGDNIRIISAPNARAEVRFVAGQIQKLVRQKDYRYRDIAVIASDIDCYEHYIRAYFNDYAIPFFIDKPRRLNRHPVVQLISSALQVVTGGFSHSDIFAYLKTDLVPIDRSEIDLLENYCLAFGAVADDWKSTSPWQFAGEDNQEFDQQWINQIRLKVVGPLLSLRDRLCPVDGDANKLSPAKFTEVIFGFLDELKVRERLAGWIERASEQEDYAAVDEHRQFYDKLIGVFDELVEVFTGQESPAQDYLAIINSAFSQLTLAFIPPTLDQVLVGSIERSRHPDLKAVFLIGATQERFPVPISFDSILTDNDRLAAAESVDFELAPATRHVLADRQYLTYIAFTRPSEYLCITYPAVNEAGSAVIRSQFIAELEALFENLAEESIAGEQLDIEEVSNETEPAAINYRNQARLDSDVVKELFGPRIAGSATRLSTFAACPYQYFCRYILELTERKECKIRPLDVGDFYHRVLDALLKSLNAGGEDFATASDERLLSLLSEQISKLLTENAFMSNFTRHSAHNVFIIRTASEYLEDCVLAVAKMVRAGSFRPRMSEVSFGDEQTTLGRFELDLNDGRILALSGKIDRLDFANQDGDKAVIVFDYKRRAKSFSWAQLYHGLDMQLPIYMLAVREAAQSKMRNAIGGFFLPVEMTPVQTAISRMAENAEGSQYKAKGIFNGQFYRQLDNSDSNQFYSFYVKKNGDQYGFDNRSGALRPADFESVLAFTRRKIIRLGRQIISGKIDITPYRLTNTSPCSTCKYCSVCRFDWQINNYNFLQSLDKSQALERMKTEAADG